MATQALTNPREARDLVGAVRSMKTKPVALLGAALVVLFAVTGLARGQQADGGLKKLIDAARAEGELDLMVTSSQGEKGARELIEAFKRRFGIDIRINADLSGQESQKFNQAVAETKSGLRPTFDLMGGQAENVLTLKEVGGAEAIENWESILAQISPGAHRVRHEISPVALAGVGFLWSTRTVGILYNPKLTAEGELPRRWKDMGNPKYRGAFSLPPWTDVPQMGLLKYDPDEVLEIVRSWSKNKRDTLTYTAGVERMMLGELKFLYGNAQYYFQHKAKDASAPIALTFFEDLTTHAQVMHVVRKGARHPNAARLFALWAAGEEANPIFERHAAVENITLGSGPVTKQILKTLKERNVRPVGWFDSAENLEKFRWLGTEEGKRFSRALAQALREGR